MYGVCDYIDQIYPKSGLFGKPKFAPRIKKLYL